MMQNVNGKKRIMTGVGVKRGCHNYGFKLMGEGKDEN
jgi:hypothetical protein